MKNKFATTIILIITFVLAGVAIFTAVRLYQLRQTSITPTKPESKPAAQEVQSSCVLNFALSTATGTATATATSTATGTATATSTSTSTSTATATATPTGTPNSCNGTCGSNANCASNLICSGGFCRNPSCVAETDCLCAGQTPGPTQPSLPNSGSTWPTLVGAGLGILVVLGSLLLAF